MRGTSCHRIRQHSQLTKSEKLAVLDPNQLSLFDCIPVASPDAETHGTSENGILPAKIKPGGKKEETRRNRELLEGLLL